MSRTGPAGSAPEWVSKVDFYRGSSDEDDVREPFEIVIACEELS